MLLIKRSKIISSIYIAVICFLTYACVYAFRKPFTVGFYTDQPSYWGIDFKNVLVISQVLGYAISKVIGIKFVSELKKVGRGKILLFLILLSWIPLLLFPFVSSPFKIACLFFNGIPLGIIWGIVFSYIEGREATDFLGTSLAVSYIVSSGVVKSTAKWLQLSFDVAELWIPFVTGLIFFFPLVLLVYLLEKIPQPSTYEMALKTPRIPMTSLERNFFLNKFRYGIISFILIYIFLTIFRDLRDNFAADIWSDLGFSSNANVFTNTEIPIALIVLVIVAAVVLIKNNKVAFMTSQLIVMAGFLIVFLATVAFKMLLLDGFYWMFLVGLGLYMGYIPFNSILFDRMIAAFKLKGNVGFLMYLMDSFGYVAAVLIITAKNMLHINVNWVTFYSNSVLIASIVGLLISILTFVYFLSLSKKYLYDS